MAVWQSIRTWLLFPCVVLGVSAVCEGGDLLERLSLSNPRLSDPRGCLTTGRVDSNLGNYILEHTWISVLAKYFLGLGIFQKMLCCPAVPKQRGNIVLNLPHIDLALSSTTMQLFK